MQIASLPAPDDTLLAVLDDDDRLLTAQQGSRGAPQVRRHARGLAPTGHRATVSSHRAHTGLSGRGAEGVDQAALTQSAGCNAIAKCSRHNRQGRIHSFPIAERSRTLALTKWHIPSRQPDRDSTFPVTLPDNPRDGRSIVIRDDAGSCVGFGSRGSARPLSRHCQPMVPLAVWRARNASSGRPSSGTRCVITRGATRPLA